jgi:hypothetical protein
LAVIGNSGATGTTNVVSQVLSVPLPNQVTPLVVIVVPVRALEGWGVPL